MYQTVDDDTPESTAEDALGGLRWMGPVLLALAAGGLILFAVWMFSPGEGADSDPVSAEPVARAAYLRAISEPNAALRRARLTDFLNQHPLDPRAQAAQAQLGVIEAQERRDWQETVAAVYDPRLDETARLAAIKRFEARWTGYLGGRDAELADLRQTATGETDDDSDIPDRSLPDGRSPIPDTVPGDVLVGGVGPTGAPPIVIRPAPPIEVRPATPSEIVPVRVRRNVTPRYPRSAQRRGIGAIVTLALDIDARGRVQMTEVIDVEAARYTDDFIRAAERAALRTRFYPKTVNGEPVPVRGVRKRYRFESDR